MTSHDIHLKGRHPNSPFKLCTCHTWQMGEIAASRLGYYVKSKAIISHISPLQQFHYVFKSGIFKQHSFFPVQQIKRRHGFQVSYKALFFTASRSVPTIQPSGISGNDFQMGGKCFEHGGCSAEREKGMKKTGADSNENPAAFPCRNSVSADRRLPPHAYSRGGGVAKASSKVITV